MGTLSFCFLIFVATSSVIGQLPFPQFLRNKYGSPSGSASSGASGSLSFGGVKTSGSLGLNPLSGVKTAAGISYGGPLGSGSISKSGSLGPSGVNYNENIAVDGLGGSASLTKSVGTSGIGASAGLNLGAPGSGSSADTSGIGAGFNLGGLSSGLSAGLNLGGSGSSAGNTKTGASLGINLGGGLGLLGSKYRGGCNVEPAEPQNSKLRCSQYTGCRADCDPDYQFPNGLAQLFITCENGQWNFGGRSWTGVPACQPICLPPCQNNGICVAPNQCNCPENYSGPNCQFENKPCMVYPILPKNSERRCTSKSCTISCVPGHQFPDGSAIVNMVCKNGFWVSVRDQSTSLRDCIAICDPPCQNGGVCLSFNTCQCPSNLRGPQCQYSIENCSARKLQFRGTYNCSGNGESFYCSIGCPPGTRFETPPAPVYTCYYRDGFFSPLPIPQCIYDGPQYPPMGEQFGFNQYLNQSGIGVRPPLDLQYTVAPGSGIQFVTVSPPNEGANKYQVISRVPQPGICFTWEGTHYKTFDGKVFSFTSGCAHTLIRDAIDNTFSIVVQNDPRCSHEPLNCYRLIKVYFDRKEYILKHSEQGVPIFSTSQKVLPIPGQFPGLRIEMSAHYVIVSLDTVGSKIKWDGQQLIQVEVLESLWNRTEGLCGNIDGDESNDMLNRNGQQPQTISHLATSWKAEDLEHECTDIPVETQACQDNNIVGSKGYEATIFCRKLLSDQRFASCYGVVDVSSLLDACRGDYCSCTKQDPSQCACETLNVYVRSCTYKGVQNLAAWRDDKTCPMQCTGGRIYKSCGPATGQPGCGSSIVEVDGDDKEGCVEGCYCPDGTVLHENTCITRDQCPCTLRSKNFPAGAEVPNECNTCTCSGGRWVCTELACGSRCAIIGDPHYVTFDGKRFDFMGQCSYYLVKTPTFSIEGENVACTGAISQAMNLPVSVTSGLPSCTKSVTLKISGHSIKFKQNNDIVINGQDITSLPYTAANVTIRSVSSIFIQAELPNGIQIWWDGVTRVYVDIPPNFPQKTEGLCGTFNNNQRDDFLTPEGDIEQSVIPFANKWKTSEKCNDAPDSITSHPCSTNIHNRPVAEKHCGIIKSNLFAACHWFVDPEPYYQNCLYDMCSCEFKLSKCLCPTIAAYAEECARKSIKITWRDTIRECGVHCPSGQNYHICGNSCTRSCFDISVRPNCLPQCVEGCNCPDGQALDKNGECVPIGECKCQYDGLEFNAGYKEVRPTSKGPQLCTCINALWSCLPATPQEITDYPLAEKRTSNCSASQNKEFTTCEPVEPVTCRNMHNPDLYSPFICHPGCKCKDDYVLDTSTDKCIKPWECPCHHGGKSYKENEIVQNDCNTCQCKNGIWQCTERPCAAECTAWGDSHFKTFDGKHYDFQGQCDYVLAKTASETDSFDITIQNVPCGTLGTSCSKSVIIRAKSGNDQDVFTFTKDKPLPNFESLNHITVRQQGLFVIVEAPDIGFIVEWDRGTRVYVKVDPRWKGRVQGLCGNYNDNDADDFQTPSGGITEASAKIFGDSWKLQSYCPEALEITNTCEDRPDRKVWALKQCGILKSSLFAACHSEVPVDIYLEKCVFDACACDQGGDCECLCTALAAYAQECNSRGVPIKWRSQKLCPIQCDQRCSTYSPCISTCPIETCDNILTVDQLSKTCKEDTCIEGCVPKPCPSGQIYLNSSFLECVPRNICKPVCMEFNDIVYFEGDLLAEDACHSCYCSRGHEVCKGQPCTTTTVSPEYCKSGWTQWINQDIVQPSKTVAWDRVEKEPLPSPLIMNNIEGSKCTIDKMTKIECRTVGTHLTPEKINMKVECSLEKGLFCQKSLVTGRNCPDFEIRVFCDCEGIPTTAAPRCNSLRPNKEHPTNCQKFYQCEDTLNGTKFIEKTCGESMYYNPVTMVCDWPYAVVEIKPECKEPITTAAPTTETPQGFVSELEETVVDVEIIEPTAATVSVCPPGTSMKECPIQCDRVCLFYSYELKLRGFCNNGDKCIPWCVPDDLALGCPDGKLWSNNQTCISKHDCMCISNDGKVVKPGGKYAESDCKICQCIDNYYTCDESQCKTTTTASPRIGVPFPPFPPAADQTPSSLISTVTPPEKCEENRFIDLIQGDEPLPDSVFNASSVLSPVFAPKFARFNTKPVEKSGGSWAPQFSTAGQYLVIDLGQPEPIYGVKIKGNPLYDDYVTSYRVDYSPDGDTFLPVLNKDRLAQIFRGSIDSSTPVQQVFDTPFEAQIVRIHPDTWHGSIALQVELIGCGEPIPTTSPLEPITIGLVSPPMCDDSMGLDEGLILYQQISVSSELDSNHSKPNLKFSERTPWQPLTNSPTEFVQFDFLEPRNITGIDTKGGPDGWVTAYTVRFSHDNKKWNPIIDKKSTQEQIFLANVDGTKTETNYFDFPVNARYIRVIPTKWENNIQMQIEVLGCFEAYPTVEEISTTTQAYSPCDNCPGVETEPLELEACRCSDNKWWDGENCVNRTDCPCFVGHISYPVGAVYKKEDCLECICKLYGVPYCNVKKCDQCENGLRSTLTANCKCTCQPCPEGTTLCPTSNICINSTLWCNGIQDCPDDENNCFTTLKPTQPTLPPLECPTVQCPIGYVLKKARATKHLSPMFATNQQTAVKTSQFGYDATKTAAVKGRYQRPNLSTPSNTTRIVPEPCVEYKCVSTKPPPDFNYNKYKECPVVSCPDNYVPVFENDMRKDIDNTCPIYTCWPPPLPDAVCNITGRTFNTFDETEYKYDICNHIVARDLENNEWDIILKKNCTESCTRKLVIYHQDHLVVLHSDLTVEYDDYKYTVDQIRQIGSQSHAFYITHLGHIILFVSNRYGFWILWDKQNDVKLGVVRKLIGKVDGLCGYFTGISNDDKRKPDGTVARSTVDFGNSWLADSSATCETTTCPLHIQNKAIEICKFKDRILEPCSEVINIDSFVSRCIETTCDCLQTSEKNRTAEEDCRCSALENFVVDCLTAEPNADISDWRTRLNCPIACEAPLVHHDCFTRRCEETCDSTLDPTLCPKVPNVCFPGCYCPAGYVKKGNTCIKPSSCRDCECNVLPHLQYVTYDNSNFTLNANCVYVMSRDVLSEGNAKHKFQVLITNGPCYNNQYKICVGKVTILYQNYKIHILNDMLRGRLRLVVNGRRIDDFSEISDWAEVFRTATKHIKILLTDIQVEVSVYYPSLGVSVKAPSFVYGGKLEGLCGNCDGNPYNDFREPSGKLNENIDDLAMSWLYDKLPVFVDPEQCRNQHVKCQPLPKDIDPCKQILDHRVFGQCLRVLDPTLFLEWCKKDTCNTNHPELGCTAIESYARDCANAGFCINWRTNVCPPTTCPIDKVFDPCGTSCPKTCESIKENDKPCSNKPFEGCFCPEGKVLRNDTCVLERECEVCDNEGHGPGDKWRKDECTNCTCDGTTLKCETERCSSGPDKICGDGYKSVTIKKGPNECCNKYACIEEPTAGPTCESPQQISCSPNQVMKLATKPNGCEQFICACKSRTECEPIKKATSLEPGYVRTIDDSGCCPEEKITCQPETCPKPEPCPQYYVFKNETGTGRCCPLYTCEIPKNKCIYDNEYIAADEGGERPRTALEKQKVLKSANERWQDGPCRQCVCELTSIGNYQASCSVIECGTAAISEDYYDYEFETRPVYDQCCPEIKRVACKHEGKTYPVDTSWTNPDDLCREYKCLPTENGVLKQTKITSCETTCDIGFEYVNATKESKLCCGSCKPKACVVGQKVFEEGKSWSSEDNCIRNTCVNNDGVLSVQSTVTECPELSPEIINNFVYETTTVKGECCKVHKITACKVGDKVYKVGDKWPSPDGDKCKQITCIKNEKQEITKQETIETCKTNCSLGWEYQNSSSTCCGECVQVACVVNGTLKQPDEEWTSPDNCTTYRCDNVTGQLSVVSDHESCPSLEGCPEANIYVRGCCKHCNISGVSQKICALEEVPLNKTIGIIKITNSHGDCVNKEPIKSFTECVGSCKSSTVFNPDTGIHEAQCSCCGAIKNRPLPVKLECGDGQIISKVVATPLTCDCQDSCSKATKSNGIKTGTKS